MNLPPKRPLSIEEIKRRLLNKFNIEEDDLKIAKVSTEEEIRQLYSDMLKVVTQLTEDDMLEKSVVTDNYKLTKAETAELIRFQENLRKEKANKKKKRKALEKGIKEFGETVKKADYEANSADLSHLPEKDRVSYDEAQKAIEDLGNIDFNDLDD